MSIEFYLLIHANLFCAEYQIKTIRKFCKDPFKIIILDSNCGEHTDLSVALEKMCAKESVDLIKIPNELCMRGHGVSHILGTKLNYVYNNIIKQRQPKYFAFLDQDMFMFKDFTIIPFLDKYGMWGDVNEAGTHKSPSLSKNDIIEGPWSLHPWLSFYKFDFIKDQNMDWYPADNHDTGGMNWFKFISKNNFKKQDYWVRDNIIMMYPWKEISNVGPHPYEDHYFSYQNSKCYGQVQINNEFIHMLNSPSNLLHPKVAFVRGFLESKLM